MGFSEKSLLFSENVVEDFRSSFNEVIGVILEQSKDSVEPTIHSEIAWMKKVIQKNVFEGSFHLRGLLTIDAFRHFAKHEPSKEELEKAFQLGWCAEFGEASRIILDDINENNVKRNLTEKGETWHKNKNIGMTAINDGLLLGMLSYRTFRHFFKNAHFYNQISVKARHFAWRKLCGNCLATATAKQDLRKALTFERYSQVAKLKNNTTQPVLFGIILAGHGDDKELLGIVEKIMDKIFQHFQIHNDFYSVFGIDAGSRSAVMKNALSETADSLKHCSWLVVKAAECENITDEEFHFLVDFFKTQNNSVDLERIKTSLIDSGIVKAFQQYRESAYEEIMNEISNYFQDWKTNNLKLSPISFFQTLLNEIKGI